MLSLQSPLAVGESDATVASDGTQTQIIKLQDDDAPMQLGFAAALMRIMLKVIRDYYSI